MSDYDNSYGEGPQEPPREVEPEPRPRENAASLEAAGWTPPTTIGGTWCRVSPEGIYEFWPRPETSCDVVPLDGIKALLGTTTTWEPKP